MIVLNDEFNNEGSDGRNGATSLNPMDISDTRQNSYQNWNKYEKLNEVQDSENSFTNSPEMKKTSFSSNLDKLPDYTDHGYSKTYSYNVDHPKNEMESVVTVSKFRKVYPSNIEKLPLVLQHSLLNDNSIIHYHEHDHIHRHKKMPSSIQKLQGKLKFIKSSGLLFEPEHDFESTKSHYHQRDYPRTRSKQKHKSRDDDHFEYGYHNNGHKNKYGDKVSQKNHYKYKRGDYHFSKHRKYPRGDKGRY